MKKIRYKISIIGMGYVGLPLACEFGKYFDVIGYDINQERILELRNKKDITYEVNKEIIQNAKNLTFTSNSNKLKDSNIYIITVPTPINKNKKPNLFPLKSATALVGKNLNKNDIVIYESTVYPGATEEVCVPLLEKNSNLYFNKDFFCGYSPERINPGDKDHRLPNIVKIISGSNPATTKIISKLYLSIIKAGVHIVSSIKTAEASKVIENVQRDLNIALSNELSIIFDKLNIDTKEVIDGAATKWNFQKFYPGLVGGHCIGVDPYYLTYKSKISGVNPKIILSGRKLNDSMPTYIANRLKNDLKKIGINKKRPKIIIFGLTFKENCPDIRNSKVFDLISILKLMNYNITANDPFIKKIDGIKLNNTIDQVDFYDVAIVCVGHNKYIKMGSDKIKKMCKKKSLLYDLKSIFTINESDFRL